MGEARIGQDKEEFVHKALSDYFDFLMKEEGIDTGDEGSTRAFGLLFYEDAGDDNYRFMSTTISPGLTNTHKINVLCRWPLAPALAQIVAKYIEEPVARAVKNVLAFREAQAKIGGPDAMEELFRDAGEGADLDGLIKLRLREIDDQENG